MTRLCPASITARVLHRPRALVRSPILIAAVALLLAGCQPSYSPNQYDAVAMQQANKVDRGVIVGRRQVAVSAEGTVGAVAGGAAGGIAGSQAPGSSVAAAFGALGGTLVGGLVGTAAEHATGDTTAWEYIVREPSGGLLSVTQADKVPLAVGQKVLVIAGKQARIVPDYTVAVTGGSADAAAKPVAAAPPAAAPGPPPEAMIIATPLPPPATAHADPAPTAPGP